MGIKHDEPLQDTEAFPLSMNLISSILTFYF